MNMFGWSTWGGAVVNGTGMELRLYHHYNGQLVALPEDMSQTDAFLLLGQLNDWLDDDDA